MAMSDQDRFVHVVFQLDANRINASGSLENMNQLESWRDAGVVLMHMSQVAQGEARAGRNAQRSRKAISYIFSITYGDTPDERAELQAIEHAIFPDGVRAQNERNDVEIVFNAKKYGAILVTADGGSKRQPRGILGSRSALRRLGVTVMTDSEAVAYVRQKISERDERLRFRARREGTLLPPWVGAH
jgi:hypothetical protein